MYWKKLFDFRVGRANRGQFWLYGGVCLSPIALYVTFPSLIYFVIPLIIINFYPFIVLCFRRVHDLGLSGASEMDSIVIDPDPALDKAILGFGNDRQIHYFGFLPVLFQKGNELENAFGFPPEGFGLKSMIAEDYSAKQKEKDAVSDFLTYQNNKEEAIENAFETKEFKGRNV